MSLKIVSLAEFESIEREIRKNHREPGDTFVTWTKLHAEFKNGSAQTDKPYRWTYFRVYSELCWQLHSELSRDEFVSIAIGRQIAMAFLLDFDVWKTIMWYIASRGLDDKDMGQLYSQIRNAFFESEAYVGTWKGNDVVVKDLIADIRSIRRVGVSSLEAADAMTKIKTTFFSKADPGVERYVAANPEELVEQFVGLFDFFIKYEPDQIWNVVQAYTNPSYIDSLAVFMEQKEKALAQLDAGILPENGSVGVEVVSQDQVKPNFSELKQNIEALFERDASGDFKDPELVMGALDQWATQYNDDSIREMLVFNEGTGKFEWNTQLTA